MDIKLKFAGIYAIRHNTNGKVYVGQSRCISSRIKDHQRGSSCINLRHAIECDGWSAFTVEVLEQVDDVTLLNEREQYWIDRLQSCSLECGYNATSKAHGPNEEARAKMRAAKLGKKLSPEHIASITRNHVRGKKSKKVKSDKKEKRLGDAIRVKITPTQRLWLETHTAPGITISDLIREALDNYIAERHVREILEETDDFWHMPNQPTEAVEDVAKE